MANSLSRKSVGTAKNSDPTGRECQYRSHVTGNQRERRRIRARLSPHINRRVRIEPRGGLPNAQGLFGRPLRAAALTVEAHNCGRSRHWHARISLIAVAEIEWDHACAPTIWAASVVVQQTRSGHWVHPTRGSEWSSNREPLNWRTPFGQWQAVLPSEGQNDRFIFFADNSELGKRVSALKDGNSAHP